VPRPGVDETGPATALGLAAAAEKVILLSVDPPITLAAFIGPDGIELSSGYGGWSEQTRPKRRAFLRWDGAPVFRQTANLMFDGWSSNQSVQADVDDIERLATPRGTKSPPTLFLYGSAWRRAGANWVVDDLQFGDKIYTNDGTLVRQVLTLTLAQQTSDDRIRLTRIAPSTTPVRTYRVRKGDTMQSIAAHQLGNASRAKDIATLNGIRDWRAIKVNQVLKLPTR
jgi:nucleoid-associated protein YgaU